MTAAELDALIELAMRAPKSLTERLWLDALIARLSEELKTQQEGK